MRLLFSNRSSLNATVTDIAGQVLYRVETPCQGFGWRTSIIYHVAPNEKKESADDDEFTELGRILHKPFGNSVFVFKGQELSSSDFFHSKGFGYFGRKIWSAPDGQQYEWKVGHRASSLFRADTTQPVAVYHVPHFRLFKAQKKSPIFLEVADSCRYIMDYIVFTFVYIDKLRRDKKFTAAASNSSKDIADADIGAM